MGVAVQEQQSVGAATRRLVLRPAWARSAERRRPDPAASLAVGVSVVLLVAGVWVFLADIRWVDDGWFSRSFVAGSVAASVLAVLLASRRPGAAAVVAALPFCWLIGHRQWLVWWEVALLAVVAIAAWRSWRRALIPAALVLVALTGVVPRETRLFVLSPNYFLQPGLNVNAGWPWPLDDASGLVTQLALLVLVVVVPAAAGVVLRSDMTMWQLRRRGEALDARAAVQAERSRLASDLHDVIAHHVSLIAVRAETAPYETPEMDPRAREVLAEIADDARRALGELRGVLGVLRSPDAEPELAPQPLLQEVPRLVLRAEQAGSSVTTYGLDAPWVLPDTIGHLTYRLVQETLTNVRRHAPGADVQLRMGREGDVLMVQVANGPGRRAADEGSGSGHGLLSMRERVHAFGGTLTAGPASGGGFMVTARVPIEPRP